MPFGDIFSKFKYISLETADGKRIRFKNNLLSKIAFKILGMPHIGLRRRARNIMGSTKNFDKVLDAGSGSGIYSFSLAKKSRHIEAIDISKSNIAISTKINIFKNIDFRIGDLTQLSYQDKNFDAIICSDVLEHIKNDKKAFSELSRVLKTGGILLLTVPSNSQKNKKTYKQYNHERAGYSLQEIQNLCIKNNLTILKYSGYSSSPAEFLSNINYKLIENKFLLGLFFYPLYGASIISDVLFRKNYSGLFFKIRKN